VKSSSFTRRDCRSTQDSDGSFMDKNGISATDVPCDVRVYASGLRNAYDFVFHSNGYVYAPDNGLGVTGTFPNIGTPSQERNWKVGDPCTGFADASTNNPGERPDVLLRINSTGMCFSIEIASIYSNRIALIFRRLLRPSQSLSW